MCVQVQIRSANTSGSQQLLWIQLEGVCVWGLRAKGKGRQENGGVTWCFLGKLLRELASIKHLLLVRPWLRYLSNDPMFPSQQSSEVGMIYLIYSILQVQTYLSNLPKVPNLGSSKFRTWTQICFLPKSVLFLFPMLLLVYCLSVGEFVCLSCTNSGGR